MDIGHWADEQERIEREFKVVDSVVMDFEVGKW
jgi:hypothetical protein